MLERIWKTIIRSRGLSPWRLLQPILWLASLGYRAGLALHRATMGAPVPLPIPVLSIGNITVGGTGKTPLVAEIAEQMAAMNFRVGIVASGYGRIDQTPVLETGRALASRSASDIGDEAKLLATRLPDLLFAIDRSKTIAAQKLTASGQVQVIIVDDGFQHRRLKRTLDLVVLDTSVEPRLHRLLPSGLLREPLSGLNRADVVILSRWDLCTDRPFFEQLTSALPGTTAPFTARFALGELISPARRIPITTLRGRRPLLFAGIGNFAALRRQIETACGGAVAALELSDHQVYDDTLVAHIRREAQKVEADLIVTTEKDWMKVDAFDFGREIYYVDQKVALEPGSDRLLELIVRRLGLTNTGH